MMTPMKTPMIAGERTSGACRGASRGGMTLIEVIIAITILSVTMLGLANFTRTFQRTNQDTTMMALASDLAIARMEEIKGWRVYSTLASTYASTTETFTTTPYIGFTRTTKAIVCTGCPTTTNDYVTITVKVTGNNLTKAITKTTAIAKF